MHALGTDSLSVYKSKACCSRRPPFSQSVVAHLGTSYVPAICLLLLGEQDMIGKQSYEVSMDWAHVSGHGSEDELALTSVCHQAGEEVIAIRSLHDGGNKMVLTQIVRRPAEKYEVRAKHFFKRVTSKSELRSSGGGRAEKKKQQHLSSNIVTVRRKK